MFLGGGGSGKSSVLDGLMKVPFRKSENVITKAKELEEFISLKETNDSLTVWDCSGKSVFLDVLSAFFTVRTMFLIAFDASKILSEEKLSIPHIRLMIQWMQFVYASLVSAKDHAFTKIMMIGSRGDKMRPETHQIVVEVLKRSYENEAFKDIILSGPLIIDNTTAGSKEEDPGYGKILEAVHSFAACSHLKVNTPESWIRFQAILKDRTRKEHASCMLSFDLVVSIAESCNIPNESVPSMLSFYHELGVFLYYAEVDLLKDTVFIDPQWLFQQLCKLMMPRFFEITIEDDYIKNLEDYGLLQLTSELERNISKVCGLNPICLVALLEHFHLATKVTELEYPDGYKDTKGDSYFVPSTLKSYEHDMPEQTLSSYQSAAALHIAFKMGSVPPGFFVRLAAQMTTKYKPLFGHVYCNRIMFGCGNRDIVTISESASLQSIQVDFVEIVEREQSQKHDFASSCLSFRNELYGMCINILRQLPLFFAFLCKKNEHFIDLEMVEQEENISSKHQTSPMLCTRCIEPLEMKPEHKYWLPTQVSYIYRMCS